MAVANESVVKDPAPVTDPAAPAAPTEASPEKGTPAPEQKPQAEPEAKLEAPTGDPFVSALMEKSGAKTPEELMAFVSTRIPDLMSQRDLAKNDADKFKGEALSKDDRWIGWIRAAASRGLSGTAIVAELDKFAKSQEAARTTANATEAEALRLINDAYEAGDARFASFLKTIAQAADGKLSKEKLASYRSSFEKFAGNGTTTTPATATTEAPKTKTPPTVPGSGANGGKEPSGPAWTGGDQSRTLLSSRKKP